MYHELRSFLIEPLEIIAAERMQLLEGRGIIERDYKPGPPLEISFEDEVFDSTAKVRQFGETLEDIITTLQLSYTMAIHTSMRILQIKEMAHRLKYGFFHRNVF